jgi:hypothetical protein
VSGVVMREASGVFRLGENWAASFVLMRRIFGWTQALIWGALLVYIVSLPFVVDLIDRIPIPPTFSQAFGISAIVVYGLVFLALWITLRRRISIKVLEARGVPNPLVTAFVATPDGFFIRSAIGETRLNWSAVSELIRTRRYWIVMGGSLGYCVPRRFFDGLDAERAFVRDVAEHLDEAARKRSRKALASLSVDGRGA